MKLPSNQPSTYRFITAVTENSGSYKCYSETSNSRYSNGPTVTFDELSALDPSMSQKPKK